MIVFRLGEKGQAMAEFVVTLPVYLLLFFAVIYFGNIGVLNQRVNKAARYAAWNNIDNKAIIEEKFFAGFDGELTDSRIKRVTPFSEYDIKNKVAECKGGGALGFASDLMSWAMGAKEATIEYKYPTPIFGNLLSITLKGEHLVAGRENIVERLDSFVDDFIRELFGDINIITKVMEPIDRMFEDIKESWDYIKGLFGGED